MSGSRPREHPLEEGRRMERYTLEDHEAYRKEQDEKAAKEEEARREKTEKESARRAWLASKRRKAPLQG